MSRLRKFSLEPHEYILFVGRLIRSKGCHLLLDAYSRLKTDKTLVIVGGVGYKSKYYRDLISHKSENVRFLGFRSGQDLRELFGNCCLFVQPSESEGLSMSLLEALSFARPVVYSDIPENREVASGCGLSFVSGDSEDLARAMSGLLAEPDLGSRLGAAGRDRVAREYNWEEIADATEQMYFGLCDA